MGENPRFHYRSIQSTQRHFRQRIVVVEPEDNGWPSMNLISHLFSTRISTRTGDGLNHLSVAVSTTQSASNFLKNTICRIQPNKSRKCKTVNETTTSKTQTMLYL